MLHYFDRASMAHSLEVRVPFLDHRLVEAAATIPPAMKVDGSETKRILRVVAQDLLPPRVLAKPKVGFFNTAVSAWFQAQMRSAASEYLLQTDPHYGRFLERAEVEHLVRHRNGDPRASRFLLAVLMLEVWLSTFLPRATAANAQPPARATA
jgi:asparagine synthase (glutamine-hydrolysing)